MKTVLQTERQSVKTVLRTVPVFEDSAQDWVPVHENGAPDWFPVRDNSAPDWVPVGEDSALGWVSVHEDCAPDWVLVREDRQSSYNNNWVVHKMRQWQENKVTEREMKSDKPLRFGDMMTATRRWPFRQRLTSRNPNTTRRVYTVNSIMQTCLLRRTHTLHKVKKRQPVQLSNHLGRSACWLRPEPFTNSQPRHVVLKLNTDSMSSHRWYLLNAAYKLTAFTDCTDRALSKKSIPKL